MAAPITVEDPEAFLRGIRAFELLVEAREHIEQAQELVDFLPMPASPGSIYMGAKNISDWLDMDPEELAEALGHTW